MAANTKFHNVLKNFLLVPIDAQDGARGIFYSLSFALLEWLHLMPKTKNKSNCRGVFGNT